MTGLRFTGCHSITLTQCGGIGVDCLYQDCLLNSNLSHGILPTWGRI